MALRGLYIINPDQVIEQITMNNMGIGRNVDEAKRLLQACQFVAEHGEVIFTLHVIRVIHAHVFLSPSACPCSACCMLL